jgi:CheY-like chemotaxis protein
MGTAIAQSQHIVLVVEDEWLLRMHLVDEMQAAGWQTVEAASGEAALACLDSTSGIDILLTDIRLGGPVDGWQVADHFRALHPGKPVIYVSANPDLKDRRVPGSLFMGKPCDVGQLVRNCQKLLSAA